MLEYKFCHSTVTVRVNKVRFSVRIRIRGEKNACTATDGKNSYGLPDARTVYTA